MHQGTLIMLFTLGSMGAAQAHLSDAAGMQHATEHLWLLLALVPALVLLRPLAKRLAGRSKR